MRWRYPIVSWMFFTRLTKKLSTVCEDDIAVCMASINSGRSNPA